MTNTNNAAANNNSNPGLAPSVTRNGKMTTYRNIQDRSYTRAGRVTAGRIEHGQHAMVESGKRIVLWGVDRNRVSSDLVPYRVEFKIGDSAVYDSFNFEYVGTIVAIGDKTITIENHGRKHRLSVYMFSRHNDNFDLARIERRRAEWMD
jgi:hypothetical protein